MLVKELNLSKEILEILESEAEKLNPPQEMAVKKGLLEGRNIVVSAPTASGKTLIAEMAFLRHFEKGGKSVYLVPLKALGSEKYEEFKSKYEKLGMKVGISLGDMDSDDIWLKNYNLIIASNEKMDSLLRHKAEWANELTLIISDEVHLLDDPSRGPTLEIVLTRLKERIGAQILALSATINNAEEIAEWLNAELVKSDYRPVVLKKGVFLDKTIHFGKEMKEIVNSHEDEFSLCKDTIGMGKQALVFLSTRRSAEAEADSIAKKVPCVSEDLEHVAKGIENALISPTKQCRRLANAVRKGVAFHHAGLVAKQRKIVEDNFRNGKIKFITATSSLAFGLNLPAYRVIIRDTKRYKGYGMDYIPNIEIHQMAGRAGRPRYDKQGEAILLAKTETEKEELERRYIYGDVEKIYSKLSVEPVLRTHVLALVASGFVTNKGELEKFFSKTFYAHQYGDINEVMEKIERVLKMLEDFGFVKRKKMGDFTPAFELSSDPALGATLLGKRVAELYIDPVSANHVIKNISKKSHMDYLMVINHCLEMRPLLRVKRKEAEELEELLQEYDINSPDVWDLDYEDFLSEFKTSLMFLDWMSETGEDRLLEKFNITPGELHTKKNSAQWLLYSARELALATGNREIAKELNKVRLRMFYGVKEELLKVVMAKGIGRVRARMLFRNGIKRLADMRKSPDVMEKVLGKRLSEKILLHIK